MNKTKATVLTLGIVIAWLVVLSLAVSRFSYVANRLDSASMLSDCYKCDGMGAFYGCEECRDTGVQWDE